MRASSDSETLSQADETAAREFFAECRALVDRRLDQLVPPETVEPARIHSAMRWSLFAGGKRLRPALLLATGRAFEAAGDEPLLSTGCALEMIHTYSLIHDDLPSMDDDDLRRGRPTCHLRFDEATAILAGDALQTLAFQIIAEDEHLRADVRVRLMGEIARAAGTPAGMIAGQAFDLAAEAREVSAAELERIHQHKTGALMTCAARSGAIIAGANEQELEAVTRYAASVGLLFQMTDDLLDVTASIEDLGKTPGKDARSSKATYPALYGLEETRKLAHTVHSEACRALERIDRPGVELLQAIASFILKRRG
jgi:geranylgeranyl pyrophosphate synthase